MKEKDLNLILFIYRYKMGVLVRKNQGNIILTRIAQLAVVGFLTAFAAAFVDTIWAVYMQSSFEKIVSPTLAIILVGFFSALLTVISFFSFFFSVPFIERNNKSKLFSLSLVFYMIIYLLFAVNNSPYIFILLAIGSTLLTALKTTSFGIIIRDKSKQTELSRNEGVMYTLMNVAWVIGPLIAGLLSQIFGVSFIFIIAVIFTGLALVSFKVSNIKDPNLRKKTDRHFIKNFKEFFKDRNRVFAYILGGGVSFWWALIYLFVPLYITSSGLPIAWVGFFMFAVAIPLILFEYIFSKLAGKVGFKKMFKTGFFLLFIASIFCFFISDMPLVFGIKNIYIILGILALASVGAAMCEPTAEAYFFDILKGKEELHFYAPYNTNLNTSRFIAYALPSLFLIFLPFKFVFLFFAILMIAYFFFSFRIKEIIEKRHHHHKKKIILP
jgi:MFS family permease